MTTADFSTYRMPPRSEHQARAAAPSTLTPFASYTAATFVRKCVVTNYDADAGPHEQTEGPTSQLD